MTPVTGNDVAEASARLRPLLYRLAFAQLQDKALADDAVQETLLAAIETGHRFEGRSSVRTWLIAILRHKVLDAMRDSARRRPIVAPGRDPELDTGELDELFDADGCWADSKDAWSNPETAAGQAAFFKVLEACLTRLPPRSSRAFLMREWLDLDTPEICAELAVTPGNLRILLWRARMQLRHCLDLTWDRSP
jgi:RNA polymerase sigma-70 factor (ECF subfamily)